METQESTDHNAEQVEKDFMEASMDGDESSVVSISEDSESEAQTATELELGKSEDEAEEVNDHFKPKTTHELDDDRIELHLASQVLPERLNETSPIKLLGHVYCAPTPYSLVIKSCKAAETTPLDADSILTLEDRSVVGKVFETFGQVTSPYYLVRFPNPGAVAAAKARWEKRVGDSSVQNADEIELEDAQPEVADGGQIQADPPSRTPQARFPIGTPIWYGVELATLVPVADLRMLKGTDASNYHDESASEVESDVSDYAQEPPHHSKPRTR
ncbi:H/ACA ribonucleoprotein complex non-core subunit naf1, partial [Massospora cicadina]